MSKMNESFNIRLSRVDSKVHRNEAKKGDYLLVHYVEKR